MGKRLVDILDPSIKGNKSRIMVLDKLKKLQIVICGVIDNAEAIGSGIKEDYNFVHTLIESIQKDDGVPTKLELEQCNKLWRIYNESK